MNNTKKSRIGKTFIGISLSLSVAFSGSMLLTAQPVQAAAESSVSVADQVISTAKQFMGVPYKFGAPSGRTDEFDCSSFTQYVFEQNGINLPRSSRQQANVGTPVSKDQLQSGDLIFADTNHDGIINHVAIYMGDGKIIHTYRVGIGVTISNFAGSTWDKTFVTARRVISGSGQAPAVSRQPAQTQSQPAVTEPSSNHWKSAKKNRGFNWFWGL
ncbi:C40 family peptidase [Paenibacillus sp. GCM10027626]|uniref:C40 family peptidase n=1 Tax=Paenibacillus sp. GCM10027626 TaxID=3273411 RepID=UPI003642A42E